jgi:hypothetical protein
MVVKEIIEGVPDPIRLSRIGRVARRRIQLCSGPETRVTMQEQTIELPPFKEVVGRLRRADPGSEEFASAKLFGTSFGDANV